VAKRPNINAFIDVARIVLVYALERGGTRRYRIGRGYIDREDLDDYLN